MVVDLYDGNGMAEEEEHLMAAKKSCLHAEKEDQLLGTTRQSKNPPNKTLAAFILFPF